MVEFSKTMDQEDGVANTTCHCGPKLKDNRDCTLILVFVLWCSKLPAGPFGKQLFFMEQQHYLHF